jgi:hypothetical protein
MSRTVSCVLIDNKTGDENDIRVVHIKQDSSSGICQILECEKYETYTIRGSELTLYVDENGHHNKKQFNQLFSRLHSFHPEVFVGKILIVSHDNNGNMTDIYYTLQYLKANDYEHLKELLRHRSSSSSQQHPLRTMMEYLQLDEDLRNRFEYVKPLLPTDVTKYLQQHHDQHQCWRRAVCWLLSQLVSQRGHGDASTAHHYNEHNTAANSMLQYLLYDVELSSQFKSIYGHLSARMVEYLHNQQDNIDEWRDTVVWLLEQLVLSMPITDEEMLSIDLYCIQRIHDLLKRVQTLRRDVQQQQQLSSSIKGFYDEKLDDAEQAINRASHVGNEKWQEINEFVNHIEHEYTNEKLLSARHRKRCPQCRNIYYINGAQLQRGAPYDKCGSCRVRRCISCRRQMDDNTPKQYKRCKGCSDDIRWRTRKRGVAVPVLSDMFPIRK